LIMINKIKYINISITNRCNLSCEYCDIWQEKHKKDIRLDNVRKMLESSILDDNTDIALTGGEPFLYKNLALLTELILKTRPGSLKAITTNGTLGEAMLDFLAGLKKHRKHLSLCISFDGVTKHYKQRGNSPFVALNKAVSIKDEFSDIKVKLKFTVTPINYKDIIPAYNFAKLNNFRLKIKLVENAKNYTNAIFNNSIFKFSKEMRNSIINDLSLIYVDLLELDRKDAYFIKKTIEFLSGKKKPEACSAPFNRIFVMPNGKIYSCIYSDHIGNINDKCLEDIWHSKKAELIRNKVEKYGCNRCVSYHGFSLD